MLVLSYANCTTHNALHVELSVDNIIVNVK